MSGGTADLSTRVSSALSGDHHHGAGIVACLVVTSTMGVVSGPFGILAGLATAVVWSIRGTPYALAVGHLLLVALFPTGIDSTSFLAIEAAFVVFLIADVIDTEAPVRASVVTLVSALALGGLVWAVVDSAPLWVAGVVLLATFSVCVYAGHRLELVRLGLVSADASSGPVAEETETPTAEAATETTTDSDRTQTDSDDTPTTDPHQ